MDQKVIFELTRAEAIVLDSLLARFEDDPSIQFNDQSEAYVLWTIQATLVKKIHETFDRNYLEILAKAREEVKNNY